jgi:restriction endonuclease S subunit
MTTAVIQDHTGFLITLGGIRRGVFLPKYYTPEITRRLEELRKTHDLIVLGELLAGKHIRVTTGDEIGKMAYGTGTIPFVRTSDVSNGELKTDAKQGVSENIYAEYGPSQDVRAGDIFFVRDGTYLIGQVALVTESDLPLLYQSHLLKFRVRDDSPVSRWLLLACFSTAIVKRQIRAKQFTADIIDTVGDRFRELVFPVPKNKELVRRIENEVRMLVAERSRLRDIIRKIPYWVQGYIKMIDEAVPDDAVAEVVEHGNPGFIRTLSSLRNSIFMPKYYDPELETDIVALSESHRLVSLATLVKDGIISWNTGIEVGKMAYGTGDTPFIRTSDISNWELKGDPKQNVSEEIYENEKQDVRAGDIFVVRDGTYLVGISCILTEKDTKILYCGGLYKLRVEKPDRIDPYLLLALLNAPIVRRQMRSKQFTRDIIDTLGKRLFEVLLPIPKDAELAQRIAAETRNVIDTRAKLRDRTKEIALEVEGRDKPTAEEIEALENL